MFRSFKIAVVFCVACLGGVVGAKAVIGEWSTATLPQARAYLSAASVGNQVFFAGGRDSSGKSSNVVDIYNTSTGMWSAVNLSQARWGIAMATVGNRVFFGGGQADSGASNVVDIYDTSTGTWSI